jgi:hypothetical protein
MSAQVTTSMKSFLTIMPVIIIGMTGITMPAPRPRS